MKQKIKILLLSMAGLLNIGSAIYFRATNQPYLPGAIVGIAIIAWTTFIWATDHKWGSHE